MSVEITKLFKKQKSAILERWMNNQLADAGLRDDLMSNEELRVESEELISILVNTLNEKNLEDPESSDFDQVQDLLGGISISRARQGFSPRETGLFIVSLKEALMQTMQDNVKDPKDLVSGTIAVSRLLESDAGEAMAHAGQAKVLSSGLWRHRAEQMIAFLEAP